MTITRNGVPGRIVRVGETSSCRSTMRSPAVPIVAWVLPRIASAIGSSVLPASSPRDSDQGRETGCPEHGTPVVVDLVFNPREALPVGPRQAFEDDRAAARQDEPRPDEEDTGLARADLGIVGADQACALGDQRIAPRRAVVDGAA